MKDMQDVKINMSDLYDEVRSGKTDLKTASELANVAGKYLKAEQLQLAREIFLHGKAPKALELPDSSQRGAE